MNEETKSGVSDATIFRFERLSRTWGWLKREWELVLLLSIGGAAYVTFLICFAIFLHYRHLDKDAVEGATKVAASFGALIAAGWIAVTYLNNKRLEVRQRFNERQLETILLASQTAGCLIGTRDEGEWKKAVADFWKLYWGPLVIFEDDEVAKAMVNLGDNLQGSSFERRNNLAEPAYALSRALRAFLKARNDDEWKLSLRATKVDKFKSIKLAPPS